MRFARVGVREVKPVGGRSGRIRHLKGTILRSGDDSSGKPITARAPGTDTNAASANKRQASRASGDRDMGAALRKVYQHTVEETIPAEMLDLLGKLD